MIRVVRRLSLSAIFGRYARAASRRTAIRL